MKTYLTLFVCLVFWDFAYSMEEKEKENEVNIVVHSPANSPRRKMPVMATASENGETSPRVKAGSLSNKRLSWSTSKKNSTNKNKRKSICLKDLMVHYHEDLELMDMSEQGLNIKQLLQLLDTIIVFSSGSSTPVRKIDLSKNKLKIKKIDDVPKEMLLALLHHPTITDVMLRDNDINDKILKESIERLKPEEESMFQKILYGAMSFICKRAKEVYQIEGIHDFDSYNEDNRNLSLNLHTDNGTYRFKKIIYQPKGMGKFKPLIKNASIITSSILLTLGMQYLSSVMDSSSDGCDMGKLEKMIEICGFNSTIILGYLGVI